MEPERTLGPADGHYAHGSESRPAVPVAQGFFESNRLQIIMISWQIVNRQDDPLKVVVARLTCNIREFCKQ